MICVLIIWLVYEYIQRQQNRIEKLEKVNSEFLRQKSYQQPTMTMTTLEISVVSSVEDGGVKPWRDQNLSGSYIFAETLNGRPVYKVSCNLRFLIDFIWHLHSHLIQRIEMTDNEIFLNYAAKSERWCFTSGPSYKTQNSLCYLFNDSPGIFTSLYVSKRQRSKLNWSDRRSTTIR